MDIMPAPMCAYSVELMLCLAHFNTQAGLVGALFHDPLIGLPRYSFPSQSHSSCVTMEANQQRQSQAGLMAALKIKIFIIGASVDKLCLYAGSRSSFKLQLIIQRELRSIE